MAGVKGPGRFVVFPWMDRTKRVDVRTSAFSVPPQQFITVDGGIVEMGAEVQFGIVDLVTMVREVADHMDILRSLGKTLLIKILVRKTIVQLERDRRMAESEILDELNDQVIKHSLQGTLSHCNFVVSISGSKMGHKRE
jgi:regulator of protease activity HflC (stomatin/prohibitin superfamily)